MEQIAMLVRWIGVGRAIEEVASSSSRASKKESWVENITFLFSRYN